MSSMFSCVLIRYTNVTGCNMFDDTCFKNCKPEFVLMYTRKLQRNTQNSVRMTSYNLLFLYLYYVNAGSVIERSGTICHIYIYMNRSAASFYGCEKRAAMIHFLVTKWEMFKFLIRMVPRGT